MVLVLVLVAVDLVRASKGALAVVAVDLAKAAAAVDLVRAVVAVDLARAVAVVAKLSVWTILFILWQCKVLCLG